MISIDIKMKRKLKKSFFVKLTKWGLNLGLRIPKELVKKYQLSDGEEIVIEKSKDGFNIKKIKQMERADNYHI